MKLRRVTTLLIDEQGRLESQEDTETHLYTIHELEAVSPSGYEKALEKLREEEYEWFEPDWHTELMETDLEYHYMYEVDYSGQSWNPAKKGNPQIYWSTNPDFATFSGRPKDIPAHIKKWGKEGKLTKIETRYLLDLYKRTPFEVEVDDNMGRSYGRAKVEVENVAETELGLARLTRLEELFQDEVDDICSQLASLYDSEMEYRCSEEALKEKCDDNEWLFTERGQRA